MLGLKLIHISKRNPDAETETESCPPPPPPPDKGTVI